MTKREQLALGARRSSDSGSLLLVTVVGWAMSEFGIEAPPGISEALAGYIVMIGTKVRGAL